MGIKLDSWLWKSAIKRRGLITKMQDEGLRIGLEVITNHFRLNTRL